MSNTSIELNTIIFTLPRNFRHELIAWIAFLNWDHHNGNDETALSLLDTYIKSYGNLSAMESSFILEKIYYLYSNDVRLLLYLLQKGGLPTKEFMKNTKQHLLYNLDQGDIWDTNNRKVYYKLLDIFNDNQLWNDPFPDSFYENFDKIEGSNINIMSNLAIWLAEFTFTIK